MRRLTLPCLGAALLALLAPAAAAQPTFNLSAQKNVSAKDFIQDLAAQAGLTVVFVERGQGRQASGSTPQAETGEGGGSTVLSGNNVLSTSSTTPGLASPTGGTKRADIPLPAQFNLSFSNLQGMDAYAQLREVLELMGLRAFRSRVNRNLVYISDRLSNPAQVAIRLRVLLINDTLASERGISLGSGLTTGAFDARGNPVAFGRFGADLGTGGALRGGPFPAYAGIVGPGGSAGTESSSAPVLNNLGVLPNRTTLTFSVANIFLQLQMLEQINALQTLLDQQLVVNDGETATLSQNVQFRVPQAVVTNGAVLGTTQAINARTTLNVTPVILPSKKQVLVSVKGDFSDPQGGGADLIINTNSIDIPNLRLDSGGLALLGGITRHDEAEVEYRVPVLGALPLIGELFRSKSRTVRNQRLLIMIEPLIQDQPPAGAELLPPPPAVTETPRNLPSALEPPTPVAAPVAPRPIPQSTTATVTPLQE